MAKKKASKKKASKKKAGKRTKFTDRAREKTAVARPLTEKQLRFIEHYVIEQNATQAALKAGYAQASAGQKGHQLLKHPQVGPEIRRRLADLSERHGIDAERVLLEVKRLATSDVRRLFNEHGQLKPPHELDDDTAAAVSSIEVVARAGGVDEHGNTIIEYVHKIKFWDKNSALEKAGRNQGLFPTKLEHTGKDGAPLEREVQIVVISGRMTPEMKRVFDQEHPKLEDQS